MKQKFISLALAVMLLLGVTGCAMSTPASVGSIGGVDIPAGIYLLAQYNAYNTASGAAKLATGETASSAARASAEARRLMPPCIRGCRRQAAHAKSTKPAASTAMLRYRS